MNALWKAFISVVKWGFITVALLIVLFVAINWRDEALKPDVVAALNTPLPTGSQPGNGYWILFGIDAPPEQDAYQVGKAAFDNELARFKQMQTTHQESPIKEMSAPSTAPKNIDALKCKYRTSQHCVDAYLNQDPHLLAEAVASYQPQLSRLEAIKHSQQYVEVVLPMVTAEIPHYSVLMHAVELQRMQAIMAIKNKQVSKGMAQLIANAQLSRRLLNAANSLISHMIALAMIQRDMQIFSELLIEYPALAVDYHAQLRPVLASINTPDFRLNDAFVAERRMAVTTIYHLRGATPQQLFGSGDKNTQTGVPSRFSQTLLALLFHVNATTNLFYDVSTLPIALADAPPQTLDDLAKKADQLSDGYFSDCFFNSYCLKNPIGKVLASIAQFDATSYIQRQHDMEGYIRLVRIQWQLAAERTPAERISAVLAQHPSPYTLQPMHYDSQRGTLLFEGRYQRYGQPASHLYNVSLVATLP